MSNDNKFKEETLPKKIFLIKLANNKSQNRKIECNNVNYIVLLKFNW